jgi:YVTN family beta-propeller protein
MPALKPSLSKNPVSPGTQDSSRWKGTAATSFFAMLTALLGLGAQTAGASTAYVANKGSNTISVINTATNQAQVPIATDFHPVAIGLRPDASRAYVTAESNVTSVFDLPANTQESGFIPAGLGTHTVAITPDGSSAYLAAGGSGERIATIDLATKRVQRINLPAGSSADSIAITPDGSRAYIAEGENRVRIIDLPTNTVEPGTLPVGEAPRAIAITPDGSRAYVVNEGGNSVSVIDLKTNTVERKAIAVSESPDAIAITPDGSRAYVTDSAISQVSVINLLTNEEVTRIPVGVAPEAIAIAPDGRHAYVVNQESENVSVIDTATNRVAALAIPVGELARSIAITPDQPPVAAFSPATTRVRPGVPLGLDASSSKDPDGAIAIYAWTFGDGQSAGSSSPETTHSFSRPGTYPVSLKETDAEGCSTPDTFSFTGQVAYCNGNAEAEVTRAISVAYPGVSVRCPKSAKHKDCRFKLQAIARKPKRGKKAVFESALGKGTAKPGRSTTISLVPRSTYNQKLASAGSILVKDTVSIGRSTRVRFVRLRVVR